MKRHLSLWILLAVLAGISSGCGPTPQPTRPAPTQTPWIIVVTATSGPDRIAESQPTQTPWIVVATPTSTARAASAPAQRPTSSTTAGPTLTPTATPAPTRTRAVPTSTPAPNQLVYPAPVLLDPPNDLVVPWKGTVLLKWSSVGELQPDEYYHLHLERPPQTGAEKWYGDYVYTKDTQYLAEGAFLDPFHQSSDLGQGIVYWWVRLVRKTGQDDQGKPVGVDISLPSERRTIITDPKPGES